MANVTVTSAGYFIPEIWANRALEILRANIVMAKLVTRDTEVASFQVGDTLNISIPGTFTANSKAADATVTLQVPTDATAQVILNKHKEASFLIEDVVRAQSNIDVMDTYLQSAVVAIAEAIETDLFSLVANVTSDNTAGSIGTSLVGSSIRTGRNLLNKAKAPLRDRSLVLSPDDETSVLGDSTLQTFFANARPDVIAKGAIGELYGFETYMSQYTPVGAHINLGGATGGTFTVTYAGQTTSGLAHNANAATVLAAVVGLSTVGTGNATVTATTTGWDIKLAGALAGTHTPVTGSVSSLTGATGAAVTQTNFNLGFNRGAFMLAMRALPSPDPSSGAKAVTMRDPESGLIVRVLYAYNPSYLGHQVTVDALYGVKTIRAAKAILLRS